MADSFLDTLSGAARFAYPHIQRGVREGLSGNAIQKALQAGGIPIRRSDLLELVRREREVVAYGSNLRFLNKDVKPRESGLPEALTTIRRKYSFTVDLRGTSIDTGESVTTNVTVVSDKLLTIRQIENIAASFAEDGVGKYGIDVDSAVVVGGVKAGVAGTL